MKINDVTDYAIDGGIAVITVNSPPVNALSLAVRRGISDGVRRAAADPAAVAIVLICGGRTFFAGADITEFGKAPQSPTLRELQVVVEESAKPVVAAMHGTALGGGLELALVAHFRVAVPSARCGLPEVNLGLLPGAGGTQRLPRIVGVERALELITSGQQLSAQSAHSMGLLDSVVPENDLRSAALAFARTVVAEQLPIRRISSIDDRLVPARGHPEIFAAFRNSTARRFRGFNAPESIIRAIEAAVNMPFGAGLAEERRLFQELLADPQSAALRHIFFAERQVAMIPDIPADTLSRGIERVGVIGAGTMGGGIAMNFLNVGIPVTIVETRQEALDRGIGVIRRNYENTATKGKITTAEVERRMGRLSGSLRLEDLNDSDLVIEAVFEQMEIKKDVFGRLDKIAKPGAILASNTSYLDIDAIAASTSRPESVVGLHFFSPANVMKMLEIVRGASTGKDVIASALAIGRRIGKTGVVVGNCHGFVGNRMLAQRQREAEKLILEGALPWDVDRVLYDFGFPMGPFAMRDMVGMDVGWDPGKSSSSTVREVLNEMGRRGQKSGAGYYDYDQRRNASPSPVAEEVILAFAKSKGISRRAVGDAEILDRCLYAMVNEGVKILEEGIAARASDIDVVWVAGYGWPAYRGGPMFWAESEGLSRVLERLNALQETFGDDFRPAALLERLASEGKGFKDA